MVPSEKVRADNKHRRCTQQPELNGTYELVDSAAAEEDGAAAAGGGRPAYVRRGEPKVFCFYIEPAGGGRGGWWLGPKLGRKKAIVGYSPSTATAPPRAGWTIQVIATCGTERVLLS